LAEDLIITSYHLVSQAEEVEGVNFKAKKMKVEGIVSVDRNLDVALLKIKGKVGVFALGNFTSWFFVLRARDFFLAETSFRGEGRSRRHRPVLPVQCDLRLVLDSRGILSDRIGRGRILLMGYTLLGITFATGYGFLLLSGFAFGFFLLSAGPIGGAGVACPPGACNLMT
jgi:hypothetical protein